MSIMDWRDALVFNPIGAHVDGPDISSAVTLTPPDLATKVMLQALSQSARYTLDGTTPTSSKGFQLYAGDPPVILSIGKLVTLKIIQEAATCDLQYQWGA